MRTVTTLAELRPAIAFLRNTGDMALVPTMGALHEGHLSLIRQAKRLAPNVVVSIFVNPTQFGPNEDFAAYPRQFADDTLLLEAAEVSLLWAPGVGEMYPEGFATTVSVAGLDEVLCGPVRPGHFAGVATIVAKLFNQVTPDIAIFGEKDWQQLAIIRRMARDLDFTHPAPAQIFGAPTLREDDGLAMSSRNRYLSDNERSVAAALPHEMKAALARLEQGADVAETLAALEVDLIDAGFSSVDYAVLADERSLRPLAELPAQGGRLFVAARIGGTRLIDNMPAPAAD